MQELCPTKIAGPFYLWNLIGTRQSTGAGTIGATTPYIRAIHIPRLRAGTSHCTQAQTQTRTRSDIRHDTTRHVLLLERED